MKNVKLSLTELNAVVLDLESKAIAEAKRLQAHYQDQIDSGKITDFELDGYEACFILKPKDGSEEGEEVAVDMSYYNIDIQEPITGLTKTLLALFKKLEIHSKQEKEELVQRVTRVWMDLKSRTQFMHDVAP